MQKKAPLWVMVTVSALSGSAIAQTLPASVVPPATTESSAMAAYQPLPPLGISAIVSEREDWKAANGAVGQFTRGHMDLLKWERAQEGGGRPSPSPAPAHTHPETSR